MFNIFVRFRANTSDIKTGMDNVANSATRSAQIMIRNFRTAFTTFFSVSALRMLVLQTMTWAKEFERVREEVEALGIQIDESILQGAQVAEARWRQFVYTIKTGLLHIIPLIVEIFQAVTVQVQKLGAMLGAYSANLGLSDIGGFITGVRQGMPINYAWLTYMNPALQKAKMDALQEFADIEQRAQKARYQAEARVQDEQARINLEMAVAENAKRSVEKEKKQRFVGPLDVAGKVKDELARIGGLGQYPDFLTIIDLNRQQLDRLYNIQSGTDTLKDDQL